MKRLKKYFKNRKNAINLLLEKPRGSYTSDTFHKLRVEIKKLSALFDLIDCCSEKFKRNKIFKPFKLLFQQAGKVRKLQIEEAMLKKYNTDNLFKNFRNILQKLKLKERQDFFSIINGPFTLKLKEKYDEIEPFLTKIEEKKINIYMEKKRNKILELLIQQNLRTTKIHELRKQLKNYYYNHRSLNMEPLHKADALLDLLGKWHDCQILIRQLKKAMNNNIIITGEINEFEKIKKNISSERKLLLNKIKLTIPETEFFEATK